MRFSCFVLGLAAALGAIRLAAAQDGKPIRELITCGRERVHILDLNALSPDRPLQTLWTWQAAGRPDLPADYHALFRSTDECKPVNGGKWILITSSGGAFALVDRAANKVLCYGRAANAHSADLLPNGRVAVAASRDRRNHQGDALILFDVRHPGRELWRTELPTGHGVVWDGKRQILWALADADLRSYRLDDWETPRPTLTRIGLVPLPEDGGHDLIAVPGTAHLAISTQSRCWLFDRDRKTLQPHPQLAEAASIKSISQHPVTGQIAFVQADRPNWWSERIRLLDPSGSLSFTGEQFYKVRWNVASD